MGFLFNTIRRLIKLCIKLSLYLVVFAAVIVLIPNLPPYTKFTSIQLEPTQPNVGRSAQNELLNNAGKNYKGKLIGPEAFQLFNGELYTSLLTGEIVKLSPGGHVTFVTKIGQPCTGLVQEHICGRPLGFQIDERTNSIYIVDAYYGIWKVDLRTDKKQLLVSPRVEIEKRQPKFFNSIALGKNGDFYWTDSSSDFELRDGAYSILTDPSGRLLHYDVAKNTSKVLLDDLWFPNGVVLSPNNDFVVVAETCRYRLLKYYISGPKKGKSEIFVAGIPGAPDNLRALPDGSGVLVGLYTAFDEHDPLLMRSLAPTPVVRKFLARLQRLVEIPFEYLNTLYPHYVFEEIVYFIGHFSSTSSFLPSISGLLLVDWDGNIVASYYNTDKSVGHISDAIVFNEKLHLGTPSNKDFVSVVSVPPLLRNAFSSKKAEPQAKDGKKFVEQAPKKTIEEKPKVEKPIVSNVKPNVEEKPKVAPKPKAEVKPKVEQKPKVEVKPKVEQQPKPQEQAKVVPKVEVKQEAPKVTKPVAAEPKVQNKPAEPAKPTQKPVVETKPPAPKPTTPPPPPPPAKATPPKTEPTQKTQPRQAETKTTTPKPETKTTPSPKATEKVTAPPPKTTPMPTETKIADDKTQKPVKENVPKQKEGKAIPIKEEIKSDTTKPRGETLKVIKKGGPAEIPVPNQ